MEEEVFARKYSRLVASMIRPYFLRGGDYDDLFQEGMIGLMIAVRKYDATRSDNFDAFAALCIKSKLLDAVRRDVKHSTISYLAGDAADTADRLADEIIRDPEAEVLANESAKEIRMALSGLLSPFEASVLDPYLDGYTASEIAGMIEKPVKSVDNAIRRVRRKLALYLQGDNRNDLFA